MAGVDEVESVKASFSRAQLVSYWESLTTLRAQVNSDLLGTSDLAVVFSAAEREHD